MRQAIIWTVDDAIGEITNCHEANHHKPLLVGIYGNEQWAGKSHFYRKALERLHRGYAHDVYQTTSPGLDAYLRKHYHELEYLFYEVGVNSECIDEPTLNSWNHQISPFTGRGVDMNVFVYNPLSTSPNLERLFQIFDIVVSNPHSPKIEAR